MNRFLIVSVVCLAFFSIAHASVVKMKLPSGNYPKQLPDGSLDDPSGKPHSKQSVLGKVIVAIFSVPNMSQGDVQEKWAQVLADDPKTKVSDNVGLYLLEDMSQAGMFKGMAQDSMKKQFTPLARPVLILDQTGQFFKKFGIKRNTTQILIYDKTGALQDVETDMADTDSTAKRVKAITRQLGAK